MPLSDDQFERYSRQILVPGIGEIGQERLLGARILVVGHARGVAQAALYLEAAGVTVTLDAERAQIDSRGLAAVVVADAAALGTDLCTNLLECSLPVCWYVLDENGICAGVHPDARLPEAPPANAAANVEESLHDAAACDAAAAACALVLELPLQAGPSRW